MNTEDDNTSKSKVSNGWLWGPILFVITTIPIYYVTIYLSIDGTDASSVSNERGTFGDTFGALNALFTGLAFAIMIYTMMMQRKELELQREELSLTRAELTKSVEAQQNSEAALREQVNLMSLSSLLAGYTSYVEMLDKELEKPGAEATQEHITKWGMRSSYLTKMELILTEVDKIRTANNPSAPA